LLPAALLLAPTLLSIVEFLNSAIYIVYSDLESGD
jgi:hypothetical protein